MKKRFLLVVSALAVAVICCALLCACIPSDSNKAKEKLEKAEYTVTVTENAVALGAREELIKAAVDGIEGGLTASLTASKGVSDSCLITWFDKASDAKKYFDFYKDEADDDYVVKMSGKAVFTGSAAAWKAL